MTGVVRTVLGDVDAGSLGVTAAHEHLVIDSPVVAAEHPHIHLPSVDEALAELAPWREAGLGSVVDAMPVAQGGDAARLATIARRSAVHVVAVTGRHTARYDLAPVPDDLETLTAELAADLTAVEHPCGAIKVATGPEGVDARARTVFAAAAGAAAGTGAPILTHCEGGEGGFDQVALLVELGVAPERIALSHTDKVPDLGYHRDLLATGAFVVYDQGLRDPDATVRLVVAMVDAGHAAQVMVGTDGARRSLWTTLGGSPGLAWFHTGLAPRIPAEARDVILVSNPARWLSLAPG